MLKILFKKLQEIDTLEFIELKKFYKFTDDELITYLINTKYDELFVY